MTIKEQFETAVLESKSLPQKPDNETLLQLYSLYKQSTEGDVNTEPPTNMFDFVNKAKHDAWTSLKGKSSEQAMADYVALVNKLKSS
ncbi:acyl-CoA-binding protein [soil metagenome]